VPPDYDGIIDVIIEEGVKVVETAGRNPAAVITKFKAAGVVVIHKCVAIRHALTAARLGADMISMDGFDCGGHPGEEDVGNWVLLPKAAAKLKVRARVSKGAAPRLSSATAPLLQQRGAGDGALRSSSLLARGPKGAVHCVGRLRQRQAAGGGALSGRGGREHGHALHGVIRGADPPEDQTGARRRRRALAKTSERMI
jgi:hypothetical protein